MSRPARLHGRITLSRLRTISATRRSGFSLIEILVVVGIVAVLIAVLLPALGMARRSAQMAACQAHLHGIAQGLSAYTTEWDNFIPGPNTSGWHIQNSGFNDWTTNPAEPTYNMDWVSPLLGKQLALPGDRQERIKAIFNEDLRCPANKEYFDNAYPSISGFDKSSLNFTSYSSPLGFHITNKSAPTKVDSSLMSSNKVPEAPPQYFFRALQVGPMHTKVFAMDGARYVDYSNRAVTYNTFPWQDEGGNFMSQSPAIPNVKSNGSPYKQDPDDPNELHDLAIKYAYRHNEKINVVFFDGHTESLGNRESRKTSLYYPTGTIVNNASHTLDPDDVNGTELQ